MRFLNMLFLLGFVSVLFVRAQSPAIASELDKILSEKFSPGAPGAAVLVTEKNKVILRKGYGLADLERKESIQPGNVFRIGSITKQFTSVAILKLAEQGKLDLNDELSKHIPDFKTPHRVTIEHLLNHTSGIKSYTSLSELMTAEKKKASVTVSEMLNVIAQQPADFEPGDQWLYNNSGYFLLGAIIEKVTGMKYSDYLQKTFFKPLGMKSTYVDDYKPITGLAIGYARASESEYKIADYVHPSVPFSAGSIFSTVDDLKKWNDAVFGYKLVKKEFLGKAWLPAKLNNGNLQSYGYGWQLSRSGNSNVIGHGGGIDGYLSYELYIPDRQVYVCVLMNSTSVGPEDIAYTLAETVTGTGKQKPSPVKLDELLLDSYTGVYKINNQEERIITRKDGQMFSQRSGGNKFEIYPFAEDKFAFKETGSEIHFIRNSEGSIEAMELISRSLVNSRAVKTNKPVPSDRTEFNLNPTDFDVFAGEYELAPGFIIKVWREEAVFKAQATGQPAFDIFPESPSKFFLKVVDAQIEFNRDDQGNVISLTLFQAGRAMPGKKIK